MTDSWLIEQRRDGQNLWVPATSYVTGFPYGTFDSQQEAERELDKLRIAAERRAQRGYQWRVAHAQVFENAAGLISDLRKPITG